MFFIKSIQFNNVEIEIAGKLLFEIKNVGINQGEIIGIIGKNGSGKSTLLEYLFEEIERRLKTEDISLLKFSDKIYEDKSGGESVILTLLDEFNKDKSIYLLDEPTSNLDSKNLNKLVNLIYRKNSTFCIVSHDRNFLNRVCNKIWTIENKELLGFKGNYQEYTKQRDIKIREYQLELDKYSKEKKKLADSIEKIKKENSKKSKSSKKMSASDYRLSGVKTKISKNQARVSNKIKAQEEKYKSYSKPKEVKEEYSIAFVSGFKESNKKIVHIFKEDFYIEDRLLWSSPDFSLKSGDKLMLVGSNGSGKTSFLNFLKKSIPKNLRLSYFKQDNLKSFDSDKTVFSYIRNFSDLSDMEIKNKLAVLNFRADDIKKKLVSLSNGERVRLYFISLLFQNPDIIFLDEITNYLDITTIEAVEEILLEYKGILVMVSHDKEFISKVSTRIINFDKRDESGYLYFES